MKKLLSKCALPASLVLAGLVIGGCLVSGTFVIVEDVQFAFRANHGFYWFPVDLTDNSDWKDHKDQIDDIDAVGFEFDIQNTSSEDCEFNVWFAAAHGAADRNNFPVAFDSTGLGAVKVITGLKVAAGETRKVTYAESLGSITNLGEFKRIVKTGRFDYYGTSCGGTDDDLFIVTNGKVIVTVSASG